MALLAPRLGATKSSSVALWCLPSLQRWVLVDVELVLGCITAQETKSTPVTASSIPGTFLMGITLGLTGMSASHPPGKPSAGGGQWGAAGGQRTVLSSSTESSQARGGPWWLEGLQ